MCCVAIYLIFNLNNKNNLNPIDSSKLGTNSSLVSEKKKTATEQVNKGDLNGALSSYDSAISSTSDNGLKSDLYTSKSVTYTYSKNYKSALDSAKSAVDNKSNETTLANLAWIYSLLNDKENAIKYYTEAINFIKPKLESEPELSISLNSYTNEVKRLKGI